MPSSNRCYLCFSIVFPFRFHVCAQCLPFGQTVAKNPLYFLKMIWDMAKYTNRLIRLSNKGIIYALRISTFSGLNESQLFSFFVCLSVRIFIFTFLLSYHPPSLQACVWAVRIRQEFCSMRQWSLSTVCHSCWC